MATEGGEIIWLTESVYNEQGQLKNSIGRHAPGEEGPVTEYSYDEAGRQTLVIEPATSYNELEVATQRHQIESVYGSDGRLKSTTKNKFTITFSQDIPSDSPFYFVRGEVVENDSNAQTTSYEYDAYGRCTKTIYADGSFVATAYDVYGRRIAETDQLASTVSVEWSKDDWSFVVPNSSPVELIPCKVFEYDDAGNLIAVNEPEVQIDYPRNSGNVITVRPRYEYAYDAYGNNTAITTNAYLTAIDGNLTVVYLQKKFDNDNDAWVDQQVASRLLTEAIPSFQTTTTTYFTYDVQHRQTLRQLPMGVAAESGFTEKKRYKDTPINPDSPTAACSVGNGQLEYEFDFEGHVVAYRYDNSPGGSGRVVAKYFAIDYDEYCEDYIDRIVGYTYDAFGRKIVVDNSNNGPTTYEYDNEGHQITAATSQGTIHYEYDLVTGLLIRTYTGLADPRTARLPQTVKRSPTPVMHMTRLGG